MKHIIPSLLFCTLLLTTTTSCASSPNNSSESDQTVIIANAHGDRVDAAKTLEELSSHSDVIIHATVAELEHTVTSETDRLMTIITPQDITVVKGAYQNEQLVSPGGFVPIKEYSGLLDDINKQTFQESAEFIEYHWEKAPIIKENDEIVFFGEIKSDGTLKSTYFTQGAFLVQDGIIYINKDTIDEFLYEDFYERFGESVSVDAFLESIP